MSDQSQTASATTYPVLPLRDIVVFPHMIVPLFVGREKSVRALEEVSNGDGRPGIWLPVSMKVIAGA